MELIRLRPYIFFFLKNINIQKNHKLPIGNSLQASHMHMALNQISVKWYLWNQNRHLKLQKPNWKANENSKACSTYHNGTQKFTSRSKSPMTPSTSPAAPTNPMDSPNNKAASIATVKGWESIITCILENVVSQMQLKVVDG